MTTTKKTTKTNKTTKSKTSTKSSTPRLKSTASAKTTKQPTKTTKSSKTVSRTSKLTLDPAAIQAAAAHDCEKTSIGFAILAWVIALLALVVLAVYIITQ